MNSKKIAIISLILIVVTISGVYASSTIFDAYNTYIDEKISETISTDALAQTVNENLKTNSSIKNAEYFKSIMDCCDTAQYENVASYVSFICENTFTLEQIKIINKILEKGTTIQTLNQVYNFWLTTDEPFSMVEDICACEDRFFSEFWYEDAFNHLTENVHGELTGEDVRAYIEEGITEDDILTANVLSRKEGQNINKILDRVKDGEKIEDIICEIYNVKNLPEEKTNFKKVSKLSQLKKYSFSKNILNSDNINTHIETLRQSLGTVILDKIYDETQRLNITVPETSEDLYDDILNETGLPLTTIRALLNKGFVAEEIIKSREYKDMYIYDAIKKAREDLKND